MQSLIIHLTGAENRAENVRALRRMLPDARVVPAVVGATEGTDFPSQPGNLFRPAYPFPLSPGERGCFLSHRRCWEQIADHDAPFALIAEDDLVLDPSLWPRALALAMESATDESYIRFPAKTREAPGRVCAEKDDIRLFYPHRIGLQTVAQIVGRKAAQKLLGASATLDRPVDTFLQMHWATGQPVQTVLPNGVGELPVASTVQRKSRTSGKLMREISRSFYRAQVAMRPQKAP